MQSDRARNHTDCGADVFPRERDGCQSYNVGSNSYLQNGGFSPLPKRSAARLVLEG